MKERLPQDKPYVNPYSSRGYKYKSRSGMELLEKSLQKRFSVVLLDSVTRYAYAQKGN